MAKQDDYVKTAFRIPKEIHSALQESADLTGKSMNSEIIDRLQRSFSDHHDYIKDVILRATGQDGLAKANDDIKRALDEASKRVESYEALLSEYKDVIVSATSLLGRPERSPDEERAFLADVVKIVIR